MVDHSLFQQLSVGVVQGFDSVCHCGNSYCKGNDLGLMFSCWDCVPLNSMF